jgi:hypothetical protein
VLLSREPCLDDEEVSLSSESPDVTGLELVLELELVLVPVPVLLPALELELVSILSELTDPP